jgi:hypothetical protein
MFGILEQGSYLPNKTGEERVPAEKAVNPWMKKQANIPATPEA